MSKILQLASLSLCATALATTANANRLDFASEQSSASVEFSANGGTDVSSPGTSVNFDYAANRQGLFDKHDLVMGDSQRGVDRVSISADNNGATSVPDNAATLALVGFSALSLVSLRRKLPN